MTRIKYHENIVLMQNQTKSGRIDLFKWFEKIVNMFYEEKVIE